MKMNEQELVQLLNAHEWTDIEFKEAKEAVPKSTYETVSAFANTAGGYYLVFGIKKDGQSFEVIGVLDVDKLHLTGIIVLQRFHLKLIPKHYNVKTHHRTILHFVRQLSIFSSTRIILIIVESQKLHILLI
ncbi:transcriptional regulator with HTH domain protein [Candidatus Magnetomorum sp. HK-1]|nr:transcriptional regulator with HTH domain protein [Candidatus Magnetomorum sp. HK-1]